MPENSSLRRDIASAYLVTALRLCAWIIVAGLVYRRAGFAAFALLGLVQTTIGFLEYAALGLGPAIIRISAEELKQADPADRAAAIGAVFASGIAVAILTSLFGLILLLIFGAVFHGSQTNSQSGGAAFELVAWVGVATLLRMISDAPGAMLQTTGRIFPDNLLLTFPEIIWAIGTAIGLYFLDLPWQRAVGVALLSGAVLLLILRFIFSRRGGDESFNHCPQRVRGAIMRRLLVFGAMVTAAQVADYLYAPTDNFLIWKFIGWKTVGVYTPAVQIDGAALLLVSALAAVLLPRSALQHAAGNLAAVRQYYVRGTLATFAILAVGAPIAWWIAPHVFQFWLGNSMPQTCAILPLVLVHTVVGGSGMVGRSVLLAIGKVRPFTISVLIAGLANVIFSYGLVRFGNLSNPLSGIVYGTIIAVVGRCAIWMPCYTLWSLRHPRQEAG